MMERCQTGQRAHADLSCAERAYNGRMCIRTGPWVSERKWPVLVNRGFSCIMLNNWERVHLWEEL